MERSTITKIEYKSLFRAAIVLISIALIIYLLKINNSKILVFLSCSLFKFKFNTRFSKINVTDKCLMNGNLCHTGAENRNKLKRELGKT